MPSEVMPSSVPKKQEVKSTLEARRKMLQEKIENLSFIFSKLSEDFKEFSPNLDEQSLAKTKEVFEKFDVAMDAAYEDLPWTTQRAKSK